MVLKSFCFFFFFNQIAQNSAKICQLVYAQNNYDINTASPLQIKTYTGVTVTQAGCSHTNIFHGSKYNFGGTNHICMLFPAPTLVFTYTFLVGLPHRSFTEMNPLVSSSNYLIAWSLSSCFGRRRTEICLHLQEDHSLFSPETHWSQAGKCSALLLQNQSENPLPDQVTLT